LTSEDHCLALTLEKFPILGSSLNQHIPPPHVLGVNEAPLNQNLTTIK